MSDDTSVEITQEQFDQILAVNDLTSEEWDTLDEDIQATMLDEMDFDEPGEGGESNESDDTKGGDGDGAASGDRRKNPKPRAFKSTRDEPGYINVPVRFNISAAVSKLFRDAGLRTGKSIANHVAPFFVATKENDFAGSDHFVAKEDRAKGVKLVDFDSILKAATANLEGVAAELAEKRSEARLGNLVKQLSTLWKASGKSQEEIATMLAAAAGGEE